MRDLSLTRPKWQVGISTKRSATLCVLVSRDWTDATWSPHAGSTLASPSSCGARRRTSCRAGGTCMRTSWRRGTQVATQIVSGSFPAMGPSEQHSSIARLPGKILDLKLLKVQEDHVQARDEGSPQLEQRRHSTVYCGVHCSVPLQCHDLCWRWHLKWGFSALVPCVSCSYPRCELNQTYFFCCLLPACISHWSSFHLLSSVLLKIHLNDFCRDASVVATFEWPSVNHAESHSSEIAHLQNGTRRMAPAEWHPPNGTRRSGNVAFEAHLVSFNKFCSSGRNIHWGCRS